VNNVSPVTVVIPANVETPETLNCLVNNVSPVTVVIPANVETPETLNCLVNNVSPVTVVIPANVESPSTFNAPPTFNSYQFQHHQEQLVLLWLDL
jgi:hypothetical protein